IYFSFALVIIYLKTFSQNLVLNSSFEEYWRKPTIRDVGKLPDTFWVKYWYNTYIKPNFIEYFIRDNKVEIDGKIIFKYYNAPENELGYHLPHTGDAYIGLSPYFFFSSGGGILEHITGTLKSPLERGKTYEISFYIKYGGQRYLLYITKLEMVFEADSNIIIFPENYRYMDRYKVQEKSVYDSIFSKDRRIADVVFENIPLLTDTSDWIKLTGKYTAKRNEMYFSIGLFYQGEKISKQLRKMNVAYYKVFWNKKKMIKFHKKINKYNIPFIKYNPNYVIDKFFTPEGRTTALDGAYYFIDDVSIIEVKE
ncbi:MAG: hypothetical protein QXT71_06055, partial [Thermoplasmata archaeon]